MNIYWEFHLMIIKSGNLAQNLFHFFVENDNFYYLKYFMVIILKI